LVVVDARFSPLAEGADVLLPGAFWMEDEGTVVNPEGRVQRLVPAVPPPGGRPNWGILASLADALGARWRYVSAEDAFAEFARVKGEEVACYGDLPPRRGLLARAGGRGGTR
jgi:predicted molibdopterin-dependent oxidoreductase YjgC